MAKRSFRVFFTEHDNGKLSGVVIRRRSAFLDDAAPATWGDTEEDVLAGLEPGLTSDVALLGPDRWLFDEDLQMRRVAVEVRPKAAAGGAWVLGTRTIPVRVGFAAWQEKEIWRVVVPRFGWSLALEDIDDAGDVLRHAIFSAFLGNEPASVFDFRPAKREWIVAWELPHLSGEDDDDSDSTEAAVPPSVAAVAEDWTLKLRRKLAAPPVGDVPAGLALTAAVDRQPPRSILLVGESGVGKTALMRRAAKHLAEKSKGKDSVPRRLWATSASHITAGMMYLGMWQERCLSIARELSGLEDWLFVDRLADLLAPQADGASIADLLAPAVVAGELRLIAEASESELARCRRKNQAFVDAFDVIRVDEPPADVIIEMIRAQQRRKDDGVEWHPAALRRAVSLLGAFRRDQRFPGKAISFVDWWNQDAQKPPRQVLPGDVAASYARWSGLPIELITDERPMSRADISAALRAGVIGQDHACDVVARALARFKTGLDDPERPVASLLFVGPTGVGKTELAKQIATYLFGKPERMVRVDLSEYMTPGSVGRLLEVGGGATSLAAQVRAQPLCVVLFDELEKAHPEVFDVLLGVLGEGRLTDSMGRLVDMRMAVMVMTSNLGAQGRASIGFGGGAAPDFTAAVRAHFRPELIGRLDHVVSFNSLAERDIERIVDLEVAKIRRRPGLPQRGLSLWLSPAARSWLAVHGFDAKMGARPLRRLLEDVVVAPLAVRIAADPTLRDRAIGVVTATEALDAPPGGQLIALPA
jgi:ATP-dependent Clp protease ATP-binding subunit ClpC